MNKTLQKSAATFDWTRDTSGASFGRVVEMVRRCHALALMGGFVTFHQSRDMDQRTCQKQQYGHLDQ